MEGRGEEREKLREVKSWRKRRYDEHRHGGGGQGEATREER